MRNKLILIITFILGSMLFAQSSPSTVLSVRTEVPQESSLRAVTGLPGQVVNLRYDPDAAEPNQFAALLYLDSNSHTGFQLSFAAGSGDTACHLLKQGVSEHTDSSSKIPFEVGLIPYPVTIGMDLPTGYRGNNDDLNNDVCGQSLSFLPPASNPRVTENGMVLVYVRLNYDHLHLSGNFQANLTMEISNL